MLEELIELFRIIKEEENDAKILDEFFLKHPNIDLSGVDEVGDTAIHLAVICQKYEITRKLLEKLSEGGDSQKTLDIINAKNNGGDTALHYAASNNDTTNVRLLLRSGATPLVTNRKGQYLTSDNNISDEVISLLVRYVQKNQHYKFPEQPAQTRHKVEVKDDDWEIVNGEVKVKFAEQSKAYLAQDISESLIRQLKRLELLSEAINVCDKPKKKLKLEKRQVACLERVKKIIDDPKIDLTRVDSDGITALFYAVKLNISVDELLKSHADVNHTNNFGDTPLHWAVYYNPQVVSLLLEKGSKADAVNNNSISVLHFVVSSDRFPVSTKEEMFKLLLENGADVNYKDRHGNTALDCEFDENTKQSLKKIIEDRSKPKTSVESVLGSKIHQDFFTPRGLVK